MPIDRTKACILALSGKEADESTFSDTMLDGIALITADGAKHLHYEKAGEDEQTEIRNVLNVLLTKQIEVMILTESMQIGLLQDLLSETVQSRLNLPMQQAQQASGKSSRFTLTPKLPENLKPLKTEELKTTFQIVTNRLDMNDISLEDMCDYYGIEYSRNRTLLDTAYDILTLWETMQPFYFSSLTENKNDRYTELINKKETLLEQRKKLDEEIAMVEHEIRAYKQNT